jgi:hypothetical protein
MIRNHICKKVKMWTKKEIDFLIDNYNKNDSVSSINFISNELNRKYCSVYDKVKKMNMLDGPRMDRWSQEDIDYLIDNYRVKTKKEIAKYLGRTEKSVIWKYKYINTRKMENA